MIGDLWRISLRHFAAHKLRAGITIFGIALGVATIVAMRLLLDSVTDSYERMVERIAGRAQLQVVNGEAGVPEELLEEVRRIPGVATASPSVFGWLPLAGNPGMNVFVLAVDLVSDGDVRDYDDIAVAAHAGDPLAFLAQPDSVAVTSALLDRTGLELGGHLTLSTASGPAELTIRRTLEVRRGPATLFGGWFAMMDVFAAQSLFGLERRFTQIDIRVQDDTGVAAVEAALASAVSGRGSVERPATRGQVMADLLVGLRTVSTLAAMMSVMVGLYLVFDTMMIAVTQRRREIGVLRSLGMPRWRVVRLIFAESVVLGAIGCLVGLPLGLAMGYGFAPVMAESVFRAYFISFDFLDPSLRLGPALWGVGLAFIAVVVAAVLPAREAVRMPPVETLRRGRVYEGPARSYAVQALVGLALILASLGLWLGWESVPLDANTLGTVIVFLRGYGLLFVAPAMVTLAVRLCQGLLRGLPGVTGELAARNLQRNMRRVAICGAAFLISLGGAIANATFSTSVNYTARRSLESWFSNHDLVLLAWPSVPDSVADEIAALPGVSAVGVGRGVKVSYENSVVMFAGRSLKPDDPERHRKRLESLLLIEGDAERAVASLVHGEGVVVNDAFVKRFGKEAGDVVRLVTPSGPVELPILGRYFDMTFGNLGVVLADLSLFRRLFDDRRVDWMETILEPGASLPHLEAAIRGRWATQYPIRILTLTEMRREVAADIERSYFIVYAMMLVAFGIALLGVVNSLLAAVLDRMPEIGVLRAVGATRGQIARSTMLEAAAIGFSGAFLAALAGTLFGYFDLDVVLRRMLGATIFYRHPGVFMLIACLAGIVFSALAGWLPGRLAARLRPSEALRYE